MYKVIIVEDEEAARDHLSLIIKRKFPDFVILGEAENGQDCLKMINREKPHIILTDIRMPVMDGLELVERVSETYPEIRTLIISGYEDFEYARQAFRSGVEDYLLKPVKIEKLKEILDKFVLSLQAEEDRKELRYLEDSVLKGKLDIDFASRSDTYRIALFRTGGHVSRFHPARNSSDDFISRGVRGIQGRDGNEWFYLCAPRDFTRESFSKWILLRDSGHSSDYFTLVLHDSPAGLSELNGLFKSLCAHVDKSIRLGKETIVRTDQKIRSTAELHDLPDGSTIEFLLSTENLAELRKLLREEIRYLREVDVPLIELEKRVKEFFALIQKGWKNLHGQTEKTEQEIALELNLAESGDYADLNTRLDEILSEYLNVEKSTAAEGKMPLFFKAVCRYVENNHGEKISIGDLSSRFNLSESYLSKLFRKHLDSSYGDFLKKCRIDSAKKLLRSNSDISIQEAARMCGFDDQFYFSKVFKQVCGISPTQYKKGDGNDRQC